MKKTNLMYFAMIVACCFSSCMADEHIQTLPDVQSSVKGAWNVSMKTLKAYLNESHPAISKGISIVKDIKPIEHKGDTVMFFVDYDEGWELVSADKRAGVTIARSDTGSETFEELLDNPNRRAWLSMRSEAISRIIKNDPDISNVYTEFWNHLDETKPQTKVVIDELPGWKRIGSIYRLDQTSGCPHQITTKWGQFSQWNSCAPTVSPISSHRAAAGCAPVAFGQMLYWLNQKEHVPAYSYTNAYCEGYADSIVQNYTLHFTDSSSSAWSMMALDNTYPIINKKHVAYLLAKIGQVLHAQYNVDNSWETSVTANTDTLYNVANYFNIHYDISPYDDNVIINNILNAKPSIVIGGSSCDTAAVGHVWIVDGYYRQQWARDIYYIYDPNNTYDPEAAIQEEEEDGGELYYGHVIIPDGYEVQIMTQYYPCFYYLMNWGWEDENDNGLYDVNLAWSADSTNFDMRVKMITNFRP